MSLAELAERIRETRVGAQDKRVFLVEGDDGKKDWPILLDRFVPDWESRWAIAEAGNKRQVLGLLKLEPDWLGLVDLDEWDDAMIAAKQQAQSNLMVLPRFCLENYLIDQAELWSAIPPHQQVDVASGQTALAAAIERALPRYIRHGALWTVATPLWTGLRALGFKEALASEKNLETTQDDSDVRRILDEWDQLLDPQRIFSDFQAQLAVARAAPIREQYARWVHGKLVLGEGVNPIMNKLFGQMKMDQRRLAILRQIPKPSDLQSVFDRLQAKRALKQRSSTLDGGTD